jgi:hypothetical protein
MMPGLPSHLRRRSTGANWNVSDDEAIDQYIEARVAERARAQAARWRFHLVAAESVVLAMAVLIAGAVLGQPPMMVLRGALFVGLGSLVTGGLAIVVASAISRLSSRMRARSRGRRV